MKRILSLLLALILIVGMIPFSAMALEPVEMVEIGPYHTNPLYPVVDIPEKMKSDTAIATAAEDLVYHTTIEAAGAEVRQQMVDRKETVVVGYQASSYNFSLYKEIFNKAFAHTGVYDEGDSLRWVYGGYRVKANHYYANNKCYTTYTFTVSYYSDARQEKELNRAEEALLDSLNPSGSDYEKLTTVYDWMCKNIKYDYEHLYDDDYFLMYTAYAALINRASVCQGYAVLLYRLALRMGIDCRVITGRGNGGGHAWNIVKMGDRYYNLDSTWDAPYSQAGLSYRYYLRCAKNFIDHSRDPEYITTEFHALYPMSGSDFDPQNDNPGSGDQVLPTPELVAPVLVGTVNESTGKPVITWNQVSGAVEYEVYRARKQDGTYSYRLSTIKNTYTNSSAMGGKTYYYYVRAYGADGSYADSNIVSCTCLLDKTAVTVANNSSTGKIIVKWEPVEGATAYEV